MHYPCAFGAQYTKELTVFTLWAPYMSTVILRLYKAGSEAENSTPPACYEMMTGEDGVFSLMMKGDYKGTYYDYLLIDRNGKKTVSADPWALACGVNGRRSMVVDLDGTDPDGWAQDQRVSLKKKNPVIWETHVHDFSGDIHSGVRPEWRGKYLAFTENGTKVDGWENTHSCLDYLKQLGVTHVQLQPVADFYTVDEQKGIGYNWGYDIVNFNIPEGSYATDPFHGEVRIREMKQMIQALHSAGIGVVMDVVYNHTFFKDSWLDRTAHGEYYRHGPDGKFLNASGCGNETASERGPYRNYMIKSVLYWANEYHIDGFRFDLMGIHDVQTLNIIREELNKMPGGENILMYGEPWSCLPPALSGKDIAADREGTKLLCPDIGFFEDETRNAVSGSAFNVNEEGYVCGVKELQQVIQRAAKGYCGYGIPHRTKTPMQAIHYASCHDNFTLFDRLAIQCRESFEEPDELVYRKNRLASGIILTCAGIAFFQSGEEFLRSKHGNGNSYNGPARLNELKWQDSLKYRAMVEWYRGLIRMRQTIFPRFEADIAEQTEFLSTQYDGCVAFRRPCRTGCGYHSNVIVYNPLPREVMFVLPQGSWRVICDGYSSNLMDDAEPVLVQETCRVPAESVYILVEE